MKGIRTEGQKRIGGKLGLPNCKCVEFGNEVGQGLKAFEGAKKVREGRTQEMAMQRRHSLCHIGERSRRKRQ